MTSGIKMFEFILALILTTSHRCYIINECLDLLQILRNMFFNTLVLGYSSQHIMKHMASALFLIAITLNQIY